jgi:thiosulfate/3-mercaptopyruvate sulfurtransferase
MSRVTGHTTIVSTEELARHLGDPSWIVFDCRHDLTDPQRGGVEYRQAHIPGARFLHLDHDLSGPKTGANGRHPLPDAERLREKLEAAGVSDASQVVAYDAQGGMVAARLWWLLRWLGHGRVAVLDGGWNRWIAEKRPSTAEQPALRPARLARDSRPLLVDAEFLLLHLRDPGMTVLDARAPDRYRGQNETLDPVGGRIPGARNRFFRDNLDAGGGFKPAGMLKDEFSALLADAGTSEIVHYCGSGVSACHNVLAMEIAGLRSGRLYAGSWSEWCSNPARPRATGEPRKAER